MGMLLVIVLLVLFNLLCFFINLCQFFLVFELKDRGTSSFSLELDYGVAGVGLEHPLDDLQTDQDLLPSSILEYLKR